MENPIESILRGDVSAFREGIETLLMQKVADRIDAERSDIASTLFDAGEQTDG